MTINDGVILFLLGIALSAWSFLGLFAFIARDLLRPRKLVFMDYVKGGPIVWMLSIFAKIGDLISGRK